MAPCPQLESFAALAAGAAPPAEAETLLAHLETCADCAKRVETLEHSNTLLDEMRRADVDTHPSGEAVVQEIIAQACATSDAQTTAPKSDVALDFLAPPEQPGELGRLGGYRVLCVLGVGGMGVVCEAEDPKLKRRVALKAMKSVLAAKSGASQRFLREAQAAARLNHDHIVPIYQVGEDRGVLFLAMPLLEGESLEARLRRDGALPAGEVVRLGKQIADGLAAAHAQGLIHRDIKPANIWLETKVEPQRHRDTEKSGTESTKTANGLSPSSLCLGASVVPNSSRVKILDFGLARIQDIQESAQDNDGAITESGVVMGTPSYMAPEQARGEAVDARADLFGLGCVLYRMCTGEPPFQGKDNMSTLLAVATHQPRAPRQVNAQVPAALSDLVMRLLAKTSAERPASAHAVALELGRLAAAPPSVAPAARRPRWLVPAATILLALVPLGYFFGGTAIRFATNKGVLVIEADDEDIEIVVKQPGKQPRIEVIDKKTKRVIELTAVNGVIEAKELPDGLRFKATDFELTRAGRKTFSARLLLADKAAPAKKTPAVDPDRQVAEWVLASKGSVVLIDSEGKRHELAALKDLPPGQSSLRGISLRNKPIADASLEQLEYLKGLTHLHLNGTRVTDVGLIHLKGLRILQTLELAGLPVTDDGLLHIKGLTGLRSLHLGGTRVTDSGMIHLNGLSGIISLDLSYTSFTDGGLAHLKELKNIVALSLKNTQVTADGVKKLAAALPGCKILSDHGTFAPVAAQTDRQAAEWVLAAGGRVNVKVGEGGRWVDAVKDLPRGPFALVRVILNGRGERVTDADLARFVGLDGLTHLYAAGTPISDVGLDHLKNLTGLVDLYLGDTGITDAGLAKLKGLPNLTHLALFRTHVSDAGLQHLQGRTNLGYIDLSHTRVTDAGLRSLQGLANLWSLDLGGTQVTDAGLEHLRGLPKLALLSLGSTKVTDAGLARLVGMPALSGLGLSATPVTDAGLETLQRLPGLTSLRLGRTAVTDAGLQKLKALTALASLDLSADLMTDVGLGHLKQLPKLAELNLALSTPQLAPAQKARIRKALPTCKVTLFTPAGVLGEVISSGADADPDRRAAQWALACGGQVRFKNAGGTHLPAIAAAKDLPKDRLSLVRVILTGCGDKVTDEGLENLKGLPHLTHLSLQKTGITDAGLDHLGQLTTLTDLFISDTKITDAGLAKLKNLSRLQQLSVYRTGVTDVGLEHIAALSTLEVVDLNTQPITDAGIATLVRLPKLRYVSVSYSKITERGLALIAALPQLTSLDISYTAIGDSGMELVKEMKGLTQLNLARSQITDAGLPKLNGLGSLADLGLSERQATDAGLETLRDLKKLTTLRLVLKQLTDAGLDHLQALPSLTELHVQMPSMTPALEARLRKALPKCKVVIVR